MKTKTFISPSIHNDFADIIERMLANSQFLEDEEIQKKINELAAEKEVLESTFTKYKDKFDEIHKLIYDYQKLQIEIRKKIRLIQLSKKDAESKGSGYFKKVLKLGNNNIYGILYFIINTFIYDDFMDSVTDMVEFVF